MHKHAYTHTQCRADRAGQTDLKSLLYQSTPNLLWVHYMKCVKERVSRISP